MSLVHHIEALLRQHGADGKDGSLGEPVSALEHALQCAQLAEWGHLGLPMIAAALLHDIGRLLEPRGDASEVDERHAAWAAAFLSPALPPDVVEPVRLHVEAKRYLVTVDPLYGLALSPASLHSLHAQGGCMTREELQRFEVRPFASEALMLRRLDDVAWQPGRTTPPLSRYLALLDRLLEAHRTSEIRAGAR